MITLGLNAALHDCAAALVTDGECVAAAQEERFSRIKHGMRPVPDSAWELHHTARTPGHIGENWRLRGAIHFRAAFLHV